MDFKAYKMDGLGNDFIIIDQREKKFDLNNTQIKKICDRGNIGCDQLILINRSDKFDAFLTFKNSDGSDSAACGNGTRCVASLLSKENSKNLITVETSSGKLESKILKSKFEKKLCVLRPTMIYGKKDTHNGYGPNLFLNLASKNKDIQLFGKGEERRDHVYIDDLIDVLKECIERNAVGTINLASGNVYSFKYLARKVIKEITVSLNLFIEKGMVLCRIMDTGRLI